MKILFWSPVPFARAAVLEALDGIDGITTTMVTSLADCVAGIADADVLVCGDAPEADARQVLDAIERPGSRLRALHFVSAGRAGFDRAGLPATLAVSGPGAASAPTVAEHALALLLAVGRQLGAAAGATAAGVWDRSFSRDTRSLEGQTVLIAGLGNIGGEIATRVRAFGARTIGLQRTARPDDRADRLGLLSEIDDVIEEADVIVLSAALGDETEGLLSRERIARCRPNVVVVNVGRGGLVDTDALADALHERTIWGAGLDVTDPEPLPAGHRLWSAPNTIVSAHFAGGGSPASVARVGRSVATCVRDLLASSEPEQVGVSS